MNETEDPLEPLLREAMRQEIAEAGDKVKITINISGEVLQAVRDLARWRGITMTEVFRQAITTEKYLADALRNGDKILLEGRRGTRELVIK